MTQHAVSSDSGSPRLLPPSTTTPTLNNIDYHPHENHNPSHSPTSPDAYVTTNGPSSFSPHPKLQHFRVRTTERGTRLESSHSDNEASFSKTLHRRELRGISKPEHGAAHTGNLDPITMEDSSSQKIQRIDSLKQLSTGAYRGHKTALNGSMNRKRSTSESRTVVTENHHNVHSEVSVAMPKALVRALVYSKDDSHVLRSRTASSPRVKPYNINHGVVDKS